MGSYNRGLGLAVLTASLAVTSCGGGAGNPRVGVDESRPKPQDDQVEAPAGSRSNGATDRGEQSPPASAPPDGRPSGPQAPDNGGGSVARAPDIGFYQYRGTESTTQVPSAAPRGQAPPGTLPWAIWVEVVGIDKANERDLDYTDDPVRERRDTLAWSSGAVTLVARKERGADCEWRKPIATPVNPGQVASLRSQCETSSGVIIERSEEIRVGDRRLVEVGQSTVDVVVIHRVAHEERSKPSSDDRVIRDIESDEWYAESLGLVVRFDEAEWVGIEGETMATVFHATGDLVSLQPLAEKPRPPAS